MFKTIKDIGRGLRDVSLELVDSAIDGLEVMSTLPRSIFNKQDKELEIYDWQQALDRVELARTNFKDHVMSLRVITEDADLRVTAKETYAQLDNLKTTLSKRISAASGEDEVPEIKKGKAWTIIPREDDKE